MWRLWRKSPEGQTVLKSSKKDRYCSVSQKRTREDGLGKKVSRRSKSSMKGKGERRSWLNGQKRTLTENRSCRFLSSVESTGVPVARVNIATTNAELKSEHWKCGWRPERIGQLLNVGLVITMVRIQTVGQDEKTENQWRCVDPCKTHPYETWKNPGNGWFDRLKVSWGENRVVVRIAVLLVGAGMPPYTRTI